MRGGSGDRAQRRERSRDDMATGDHVPEATGGAPLPPAKHKQLRVAINYGAHDDSMTMMMAVTHMTVSMMMVVVTAMSVVMTH